MLVLGGDCLADAASLRAEPDVYGQVASDPAISRTITAPAADADAVIAAIGHARAQARQDASAWPVSTLRARVRLLRRR